MENKTTEKAAKPKHRPSALALKEEDKDMQQLAVEILSPGLNEKNLGSDQKSAIEQSKSIEKQQKELIFAKNHSNDEEFKSTGTTKKRTITTPTIIIEQVSIDNASDGAASPALPNARKFKRSKAPPPLKITQKANNIKPSIQTAPMRNNASMSYYGHRGDLYHNSNLINAKQTHKRALMNGFIPVTPAAAAAAAATAASPLPTAQLAPRYYPIIGNGAPMPSPALMTPSIYSTYYKNMLLKSSQINTPRNLNFAVTPGAANGSGMPITPLNHAFQNNAILTSSENYIINRNVGSTFSELNKTNQTKPKSVLKKSNDDNKDKEKDNTSTKTITVDDRSIPRKTLQSPLTSNIIKQTISTKRRKANGEPKTPVHLQKANTPHVTDIFPGEMAKFAPVSNQPLSARDENFDFNMYKETPINEVLKRKSVSNLNKVNEDLKEEDEDEDDVESKAIEQDSKVNVEPEFVDKTVKTKNLTSFKDYKIELKLKNDVSFQIARFKFEEDKKAKANVEKKEFLKLCESIWDEAMSKKKEIEN